MTDIETGAKLGKEWRRHTLGEDVVELRSHQDVQNVNFPNDDLVTDEVEINLNMLCALMLNWVGCQVDDTDIIATNMCATGQRGVQLHEQLAKPTSLCNTNGNNPVFCFFTRARYHVLALGGPGDEVVTKEDCILGSGLMSIEAPDPITMRVDHKLRCGWSTKKKTKIQSGLKIT
jgi:hypothetical protein